MNRIKQCLKHKRISFVFLIFVVIAKPAQAQIGAAPVFDYLNLMQAIDQFYTAYDTLNATIKNAELAVDQIKKIKEAATTINWEYNSFQDGNWWENLDIRDELKSFNRTWDNYLNVLDQMKALDQQTLIRYVNVDGTVAQFKVDDLLHPTTAVENIKGIAKTYAAGWASVGKGFKEGLSESQKATIRSTYGISADHYMAVKSFRDICWENTIGHYQLTKEAESLLAEGLSKFGEDVITQTLNTKDSDGNIPEGALGEAMMWLTKQTNDQLTQVILSIQELLNQNAQYAIHEISLDEAKIEAARLAIEANKKAIVNPDFYVPVEVRK